MSESYKKKKIQPLPTQFKENCRKLETESTLIKN